MLIVAIRVVSWIEVRIGVGGNIDVGVIFSEQASRLVELSLLTTNSKIQDISRWLLILHNSNDLEDNHLRLGIFAYPPEKV